MQLAASHVTLRQSTMDDLPFMAKWAADEEVMRHVAHRLFTFEEEQAWLEGALVDSNLLQYTIILNETGMPIGSCGIHLKTPKPKHAHRMGMEIGLLIGQKEEWGKGYGVEVVRLLSDYALQELNASCVWLLVDDVHERAQKAYARAGFVTTETFVDPERIGLGSVQLVMERKLC